MAYPDQYQLAQDPAFQRRVQIALTLAAATAVGNPNSPYLEAARGILGQLAASDEIVPIAREVARIAVVNPTVAATAPTGGALTDAQLQNVVNTILPALVR